MKSVARLKLTEDRLPRAVRPFFSDGSQTPKFPRRRKSGLCQPARLSLLFSLALLCSCKHVDCPTVQPQSCPPEAISSRVDALNRLRNATNAEYGFRNGVPRINLGPCGPFAKAFYEQWNARFAEKALIVFVMSKEGSFCHHVLVKLPDGSFFDGGNGVTSEQALLSLYSGSRIEEMPQFDLKLLEQRSHGLHREYPECPNFSERTIALLIANHLELLPSDLEQIER